MIYGPTDNWGYDPDPGPGPAFDIGQRVIVDHGFLSGHEGIVVAYVEDDYLRYFVKLDDGISDEFEASELRAN